jgi:DNA mismatch repair protein MutL
MNRIRLLSEQVANQIAAGEVVERPSSVVKELVENALDAESQRITVEVQAGGRSLIRVTDDGVGMNRDDALLCLERHATSKIQTAQDLAAIATMGFRGEALPSIASVSRMTLTTQERGSDQPATQVLINGGKIAAVRTAGSPPGTNVEVRQLFFNLPARRKFLRSEETEYTHIHHYLTLAALAFPEVGFTFVREGRTVWQLPPLPVGKDVASRLAAVRERMRALSGIDTQLLPVDFSLELPEDFRRERDEAMGEEQEQAAEDGTARWIRLWGFIGRPGVSRATRQDQHLFVNRRPVENRGLSMALLEGYHTVLMKGRYPVCCLFLEIDPSHLDVNVHPAKREVRFHNERAVRQLAVQAVRQTLLAYHGSGPPQPDLGASPTAEAAEPIECPARVVELPGLVSAKPALARPVVPAKALAVVESRLDFEPAPAMFPKSKAVLPAEPSRMEATAAAAETVSGSIEGMLSAVEVRAEEGALLRIPLRVVGVIGYLYVVLESDRGLVLMDQHAAHERILFERTLVQLEKGEAPSQRLLLPETVELSVRDAHFLKGQLGTLNRLGVGLSEFGEQTFLLDALPPFVRVADPRQFVLELVDELKAVGQEVNTLRLGEQTIAKTVCRHAVKANDPLAGPELESLLQDLRSCAMPYTCPHGRPTLIEMSFKELEKRFGRVV